MNKLPIIDTYAARLLMVSFFLPMIVQVQVVGAVGLYFVFRVFLAKYKVPSRNYLWALLLSGTYLLYLLAIPFTPHEYRAVLLILCQRSVSLLLLPFAFAIITPFFGELILGELIYFVYACFISGFIGNASFIHHYWIGHDAIAQTITHVQYRLYFEHSTGIHPTYMSMYLCFAISILLVSSSLTHRIPRPVKYVFFYVLLVFLLSLLAKAPLIALMVIFVHYGYVHRKTLYRYKALFAGMLLSVAGVYWFIPFFRQRMREMFSFFGEGKPGTVADNSVYVRKLIWSEDTSLIKSHWLSGVGPGRILHALRERYFFYFLVNPLPEHYYDPHNEYAYQWLCFGVFGIALFLVILAIHFIKATRFKNHLYLYLMLILSITFATETVLSRQQGVVFYALFTSFFFLAPSCFLKINYPDSLIFSLTLVPVAELLTQL